MSPRSTRRQFVNGVGRTLGAVMLAHPLQALALAEKGAPDSTGWSFPSCGLRGSGPYGPGSLRALHVAVRDGVRLALDLVLPAGLSPEQRMPTVLTMTRYWRAERNAGLDARQKLFTSHGYAVIVGDVRGTGASFGRWPHHRSREETLDFGDVIDWIVRQPWSNGQVIGWGNSYTANTVDWMVERNRPALKVAISRFPDYDPYADLYFPGGVPNAWMGRVWGTRVKDLDRNIQRKKDGSDSSGVRPVDGSEGVRLLDEAIAQRRDVPSVWEGLQEMTFRDDQPHSWGGASMDSWGIHSHRAAVEAAGTPIQSWAGWMDAGTPNGVLHRFMTLSNPQRVFIGPWSHGGYDDASPYHPVDQPTAPPLVDQSSEDVCFIRRALANDAGARGSKLLVYYTMGEERWKSTTEWPLPTTQMQTWRLGGGGTLVRSGAKTSGVDRYVVDFTATTGAKNRWATNNAGGDVDYGDRTEADRKLLTYTSAPLQEDLEVTGQAVVVLHVSSTHSDGNFFAYLEEVDPAGVVRYLTDGQLRALHRKISTDAPPHRVLGPYHSYRRADALPLQPGQVAELQFSMIPVSVLVRAGHRLRVTIAGADADTFARVPAEGTPTIELHRGVAHPSRILLPVIPRRGSARP